MLPTTEAPVRAPPLNTCGLIRVMDMTDKHEIHGYGTVQWHGGDGVHSTAPAAKGSFQVCCFPTLSDHCAMRPLPHNSSPTHRLARKVAVQLGSHGRHLVRCKLCGGCDQHASSLGALGRTLGQERGGGERLAEAQANNAACTPAAGDTAPTLRATDVKVVITGRLPPAFSTAPAIYHY